MARELCVVLMSGGMDSCVTAAMAASRHRLAALHVSYGQRTASRELKAFRDIARHLNAERALEVSLESLAAIGGSCLTDPRIPVPPGGAARGEIPVSYVPFRNTHLLATAVSWAEVLGAGSIWIGAVEEDATGYPDCRREYYEAFSRVVEVGTRPETAIRIETPLIAMGKPEIVRKGVELGAPLHLSWSCYAETERACGRCDSCRMRLEAFKKAGLQDPLPYAR